MDILAIVIRFAHIAFAVIAAGAVFYQLVAVRPAMAALDEVQRRELRDRLIARWRPWVWAAIVVLLVTGLINFLTFRIPLFKGTEQAKFYHMLLGIKLLIALAVFHAATILVMPGEKFEKYRARAGFWLTYLVVLMAAVILVGNIMNRMALAQPALKASQAGAAFQP